MDCGGGPKTVSPKLAFCTQTKARETPAGGERTAPRKQVTWNGEKNYECLDPLELDHDGRGWQFNMYSQF